VLLPALPVTAGLLAWGLSGRVGYGCVTWAVLTLALPGRPARPPPAEDDEVARWLQ
jgi:hypothetical protein